MFYLFNFHNQAGQELTLSFRLFSNSILLSQLPDFLHTSDMILLDTIQQPLSEPGGPGE